MLLLALMLAAAAGSANAATNEVSGKQHSAFYPGERLAKARENLARQPEGKALRAAAVATAAYWKELPDEDLWKLVFGPAITRSWMVWSDGFCPACKQSVPMYQWLIHAKERPWKTLCPHCREVFPKNDFQAFYRSGLNERGWFEPKRADRSLLFNTEHPGADEPLRLFGVDDGEGYLEKDQRWRFIGAYLIYGQFKQLVLGGIRALASAYVLTGEPVYAHKAGILLDRLADTYPEFDYASQGLVYEKRLGSHGYVSIWHDACEETRELALAYDQVFEGLKEDAGLVAFAAAKSRAYSTPIPKASWPDVQRNIDTRLLGDALAKGHKIHSNFPRAEMTAATIQTVLGWPENRRQIEGMVDSFVKVATAVDGVTGEKGLSGYSSYTISGLAAFLEQYCRIAPNFLADTLKRNPSLAQTWRFHIDTLCLGRYYPNSGDCGTFAAPADRYVGASFMPMQSDPLAPSMYSFFWRLYEATKDPGYAQVLYRENGSRLDGLPQDLFADDAEAFQQQVEAVIKAESSEFKLRSLNKPAWHLAILRSGQAANRRAVWLDYDTRGGHGHQDGLTLGLYGCGLDLLPDFGYPAVQFGGWETPKGLWNTKAAAHNTVLIDGADQGSGAGEMTLWAEGEQFHAVRARGPGMVGARRFERTAILVDVSAETFYVLDIFRLGGGGRHTKMIHGPAGRITSSGLNLNPAAAPLAGVQMRGFASDPKPQPNWQVTWDIQDRASALPKGSKVRLQFTELSSGVEAWTAEDWIAPSIGKLPEFWAPCVMVQRQGTAPLQSTFVGVFEPFGERPAAQAMRRLPLATLAGVPCGDSCVAVELELPGGQRDLVIATDSEQMPANPVVWQSDWGVRFDGELCWMRKDQQGRVIHLAMSNASRLEHSSLEVKGGQRQFVELALDGDKYGVLHGSPSVVVEKH